MATLLFPGRHLLNTRFQEQYLLTRLCRPTERLALLPPTGGTHAPRPAGALDHVLFAVTSANQRHSRYNPVPLEVRCIGVDRFARDLKDGLAALLYRIVPVPHYAPSERFASILLKEICESTEDRLALTPADTVVVSSTPELLAQFRALGFWTLPAELELESPEGGTGHYTAPTPFDVVRRIADAADGWADDPDVRALLSPATLGAWQDFPDVPLRVARLFRDPLLNDHGSLTEMRNYSVYAAGMNERAALRLKYDDIRDAIVPGRVADEGCADGALLTMVAQDFPDADLIGLEITGEFLARAAERQRAGAFGGAFVHFHQRNIMEPVFADASIDTTICNSTTHELWSYGRQESTLRAYLADKFRQTRCGGRLIIRDVVGPADKDREVLLWCNDGDGSNDHDAGREFDDSQDLARHLTSLSTAARFRRFAREFLADLRESGRRGSETELRYREERIGGRTYFVTTLREAAEFMMKKDYTANWRSELNEEFCFWDFEQWTAALEQAGFNVLRAQPDGSPLSRAYANPWIVKNRLEGNVEIYDRGSDGALLRLEYPVTNMVLVGERP